MSDDLFHQLDDLQVVLRSKGVFRQAKLYRRGDKVYAGWGSGFVRLLGSGGTSHPSVSWESLPYDVRLHKASLSIIYSPSPVLQAAE